MTTDYDRYRKTLSDAAERFAGDTKDHQLAVLHDDGLYRHLRFQQPGPHGWLYRFDLITWPGHLTVSGDFGTAYTFARVEDMFTFFRAKSGWNHGTINPQYWEEKIVSGRDGVRAFSEDKLKRYVTEHLDETVDGFLERVGQAVAEVRDVRTHAWKPVDDASLAAIGNELRGEVAIEVISDAFSIESAFGALAGFSFTVDGRDVAGRPASVDYGFEDYVEWDLTDWGWSYLWACNAIQWGIGQYDAAKTAQLETAAAS